MNIIDIFLCTLLFFVIKVTDKMDNQISAEDVDNDYPAHQPIAAFEDFDDDTNRTRDV